MLSTLLYNKNIQMHSPFPPSRTTVKTEVLICCVQMLFMFPKTESDIFDPVQLAA